MNQETQIPSFDEYGASFDGAGNFLKYKEQSANHKGTTVFPSGERVRVVNPNAKPLKLNPPK